MVLVEQGAASVSEVAQALRVQTRLAGGPPAADATIRVATDRLDSLIDMVGELVIAQSMVAGDPGVAGGALPGLARRVAHSGKIVRELQDLTMSLRMVPLKGTFQKMARLVRDLAKKSGKSVQFVTDGEDTEIDRNMVEALGDPLVHMMRNSVDHGIETAAARRQCGKTQTGTVTLKAYHAAGNVVIELSDDGKGLDRQKILAKAVERGLIDAAHEPSESETFALIFQPGFSTAEKITDVSGRGVGMDVVKRGIESLRGRIDIASAQGQGSTFTLRLPLTMAITDAMILRVGRQRYLLPIACIEHSFRPAEQAISTVAGRGQMVCLRGQLLPVFRLYELFAVAGAQQNPTDGLLIVIEGHGKRCALMVDELLGQQQVVVKPLGKGLGHVNGVAGGAILGDGHVALILDPTGIIQIAHGVENTQSAAA
jgi:two-component system chemotaxis sensor kinase CheA